ncbi:hypothetical protein LAZ40_09265 [Cereibacter sphaeroides]|uniref:hypothetical protein n=1 Tax=Cereibacter sphaeroides TaxID=1063 RepID=UPI001F2EC287|nr:hypothetical protein [Cereibacter sphaeroides]MCE6959240.1 hypothetical protein [Cereibacter sphaeroides]MCE6972043.1 hypothetical protein [Cereibacter sphaeroides]
MAQRRNFRFTVIRFIRDGLILFVFLSLSLGIDLLLATGHIDLVLVTAGAMAAGLVLLVLNCDLPPSVELALGPLFLGLLAGVNAASWDWAWCRHAAAALLGLGVVLPIAEPASRFLRRRNADPGRTCRGSR